MGKKGSNNTRRTIGLLSLAGVGLLLLTNMVAPGALADVIPTLPYSFYLPLIQKNYDPSLPTATPTSTGTVTVTPTETPTVTVMPPTGTTSRTTTPSAIFTSTPTTTRTETRTPTETPTLTNTATRTPTSTATETRTPTSTRTPTPTITPTPTQNCFLYTLGAPVQTTTSGVPRVNFTVTNNDAQNTFVESLVFTWEAYDLTNPGQSLSHLRYDGTYIDGTDDASSPSNYGPYSASTMDLNIGEADTVNFTFLNADIPWPGNVAAETFGLWVTLGNGCVIDRPAATMTPTPTLHPSVTPPTATITRTPGPTATATWTRTTTSTRTPTVTATSTRTATLTITPSRTPTNTPTLTSTITRTATRTPSATPTVTPTATTTPTPTHTQTPTPTFTPTETVVPSITPTCPYPPGDPRSEYC